MLRFMYLQVVILSIYELVLLQVKTWYLVWREVSCFIYNRGRPAWLGLNPTL